MTITERMKKYAGLDAKRTQGNWYVWDEGERLNAAVVNDSKEGWDRVESDVTLIDWHENQNLSLDDMPFLAAAPSMFTDLQTTMRALEVARNTLGYIVDREDFSFAECSEAEEIWARSKIALKTIDDILGEKS